MIGNLYILRNYTDSVAKPDWFWTESHLFFRLMCNDNDAENEAVVLGFLILYDGNKANTDATGETRTTTTEEEAAGAAKRKKSQV